MKTKIKNKSQSFVPYQCCPECNGGGQVRIEGCVLPIYQTCKVCNGTKIIPMYVITT